MTRTGRFEAVAMPSVREPDLRELFASRGVAWAQACHVTATTSLYAAFERRRSPALSIANLIDLLVFTRASVGRPLSLDKYPGEGNGTVPGDARLELLRLWRGLVSGLRLRNSIRFDEGLRRHHEATAAERERLGVLLHARRDFQRVLESLVAAGFRPCEEDVAPQTALGKAALGAWRAVEEHVSGFAWVREDLWAGDAAQRREVIAHCRAVLEHVFGKRERWTIAYHGFYFFTPSQWALFQLLREADFVDQLFIVHDDGASLAFESWRRFFTEALGMPAPMSVPLSDGVPRSTAGRDALQAALSGRPINAGCAATTLRILKCETPTEFVHEIGRIRAHSNQGLDCQSEVADAVPLTPRIFAARHGDVARLCDRLAPDLTAASGPSLAQLPIGAFLLRLHECIRPGDEPGSRSFVLTADAVRDMAESGFLLPPADPIEEVAARRAIRQALPFFRGCRFASDWIERAKQLERMVIDHVGRFGPREDRHGVVERMRGAVGNPLRLVPWGDLSVGQARSVRAALAAIVEVLEGIATSERIDLAQHGEFLRRRLSRGLGSMPEAERRVIEAKLDGLSIRGLGADGDNRVHVVGLVEIVRILLGREANFDEAEVGDEALLEQPGALCVLPLRGLDALGFERSRADIHLANLADGAFPSVVPAVGWPLSRGDLMGGGALEISRRILTARSEFAALSDLYLLALAVDGIEDGCRTTLSWIAKMAGESRSLSGMVSLLASPNRRRFAAVADRVGGLVIEDATLGGGVEKASSQPVARDSSVTDDDIIRVRDKLPREAVASAAACPRRFAMQWMLGPTPAFQPDYLQVMLCGNTLGVLARLPGVGLAEARAIATDMWRHLTTGERLSSFVNRAIPPTVSGTASEWRFTLFGSQRGQSKLDLAYRVAAGFVGPSLASTVAPCDATPLPLAPKDDKATDICKFCPVQSRCAVRVARDADS